MFGGKAPAQAPRPRSTDGEVAEALQTLLGEAGHVFKYHGEGLWALPGGYKDYYAGCLAEIFAERPTLPRRLIETGNRLVASLSTRALEMQKEAAALGVSVREHYRLDEHPPA